MTSFNENIFYLFSRKLIMSTAVKNSKAFIVVSQDQMLEKLQYSEVRFYAFVPLCTSKSGA